MSNRTKISFCAVGIVVALIALRGWASFRSQPQLSASEDVFKTVDALFTAITAHDQSRLTACEQQLETLKTAGQIPAAAAKRLATMIGTAGAGQWDAAARQLYSFIQAQRREVSASEALAPRSAASPRLVR